MAHTLPHLDNPFGEVGDVDEPAHANQGSGQDRGGQVPVGHHCLQHSHAQKGLLLVLGTMHLADNFPGVERGGILDVGVKQRDMRKLVQAIQLKYYKRQAKEGCYKSFNKLIKTENIETHRTRSANTETL